MVRVSVGPTLDTMGHVGGELRITTGLGAGPTVAAVALHAGGQRSTGGESDRGTIGSGFAFEFVGCGEAHVCGQIGFGLMGRDVIDTQQLHVDGFGLSGRVAVQYAAYHKHHRADWLLHIATDNVYGVGVEIDATGYVVPPMHGGLFFFGVSGVAGSFVH
jgi:hypothetical protein